MRALWVVVAVGVAGCGASAPPAVGRSCFSNEAPVCAGAASALVCVDGFWASRLCLQGCSSSGGRVACPTIGDGCSAQSFACAGPAQSAECRGGVWRALPCRGPNGCQENAGVVACDVNGNVAGDACAAPSEGRGLCTADGLGVLECRQGTFVKTATCRSCTVQNGQVICQV